MEPPAGGDPATLKDAQRRRLPRDRPTADPAHYVRGQYDGYLDIDGVAAGLDDRDLRRAAARHRQLALVGRAVLHPHRQAPAGHADRGPARLQAPAEARLRRGCDRGPSPTSSSSSSTRRPASGSRSTRAGPTHADRRADHARHGVRRGGRRGRRRPTRCCCTRRWSATAPASRARTASRRRGGSCSRCSTRRRPCTRTRQARGAPRRPTSSSPARPLARAVDRRRERTPTREARPAERRGAVAVPADRGLRVPLRLPHRRARRARRLDRLALRRRASTRPASSAACSTARPGRSASGRSASTTRRAGRYEPGTNVLDDHVEDADRLDARPRRADDGPARQHEDTVTAAHPAARRRRRRPRARAHGRVPRRPRRDRARLRAGLRLRPRRPPSGRSSTASRHAADATGAGHDDPPADRHRARASRAAASAPGTCSSRARGLLRAVVGRGPRRARGLSTTPRRASTRRPRVLAQLARPAPASPTIRWREPLQRSALAIKGLTYMPTGATVAALTTSLPETPGGERNWDYRYTWMRDTTFTLQALHCLNLDWEADEFMQFVADLEPQRGRRAADHVRHRRAPRPDRVDARPTSPATRARGPVRIGNGAFDQRQNDVYGAVLDSILLHTAAQRAPAAPAVADRPGAGRVRDAGLARAGPGDLGGARRAAALRLLQAHVLGRARPRGASSPRSAATRTLRGDAGRPTADEIHADILEHGVSERGVLRQHYDDRRARRLDPAGGDRSASCRGDDERLRATVLAIADELTEDGFVLRYRTDETDDGLSGKEGTFLICSFWLVSALLDRSASCSAPATSGAAAAHRLAARPLRRGVRRRHRPPPRQLPAGLLAPRADRGRGAHHPRRANRGDQLMESDDGRRVTSIEDGAK